MNVATKMWLWFGLIWFGSRTLDFFWPPSNPVFNAALAIGAMLVCAADHFDAKRVPKERI